MWAPAECRPTTHVHPCTRAQVLRALQDQLEGVLKRRGYDLCKPNAFEEVSELMEVALLKLNSPTTPQGPQVGQGAASVDGGEDGRQRGCLTSGHGTNPYGLACEDAPMAKLVAPNATGGTVAVQAASLLSLTTAERATRSAGGGRAYGRGFRFMPSKR